MNPDGVFEGEEVFEFGFTPSDLGAVDFGLGQIRRTIVHITDSECYIVFLFLFSCR